MENKSLIITSENIEELTLFLLTHNLCIAKLNCINLTEKIMYNTQDSMSNRKLYAPISDSYGTFNCACKLRIIEIES